MVPCPFRARRSAALRLALALALLLGLAPACAPREEAPRQGRALVVGVDGASPALVRDMIAAGDLPALATLAREGSSGTLRSSFPLLSPRIWTSMATGKTPEKHGVEGWVRKDAAGQLHLYSSADRRVHAIWNILSDAGLTVGVVNWLDTHPPEKIRGVMISERAVRGIMESQLGLAESFAKGQFPDQAGGVSAPERGAIFAYPPEWAPRFAAYARQSQPLTAIANPFRAAQPVRAQLDAQLADYFDSDERVARAALDVESELHPDLLLVYLPGIDRVSHFLWSSLGSQEHLPPAVRRSPEDAAREAAALRDCYRFVDALIALLAARYSERDLVLVVSDHGFENPTEGVLSGVHVSEAARDGILYARGPGIPAGAPLEGVGVNDLTPTLLGWFGLAPAADMDGRAVALPPFATEGSVPTYDTTPIERVSEGESALERPILEQLRSLGYVE